MKEKRIITFLALVILFVVLGVSIGSIYDLKREKALEKHDQKEEEKVVISITHATGDDIWNTALEQMANSFMEQYPNIKVDLMEDTANTQTGMYSDFLKREIALDRLGDIVEIKDISFFDGTEIMSPLPEKLTSLVQCEAASDGNIYILPESMATQGIIYNKDLFEKLKLSEPETYDEFLEICEKLKRYRLTPIVVGGKDKWHMGFWINHFFRTEVLSKNEDWQKSCSNRQVSWMDAEPRKMIESLQILFQNGYVNSDYESVSDSETGFLMAGGTVGMLYSGPWMFRKIQEINPDCSLGWFYLPDNEGNVYAFIDKSSGWGITEKCKKDERKYEAAVCFLEYFFTSEQYQQLCSYTNSLPSTNVETELQDSPILNEVKEKMDSRKVTLFEQQIGSQDTPENFRSILFEQIFTLLREEVSAEEFLERMEDEWIRCETSQEAEQ